MSSLLELSLLKNIAIKISWCRQLRSFRGFGILSIIIILFVKVNTDSLPKNNRGMSTCGVVFRDSHGQFFGVFGIRLGISSSFFCGSDGHCFTLLDMTRKWLIIPNNKSV